MLIHYNIEEKIGNKLNKLINLVDSLSSTEKIIDGFIIVALLKFSLIFFSPFILLWAYLESIALSKARAETWIRSTFFCLQILEILSGKSECILSNVLTFPFSNKMPTKLIHTSTLDSSWLILSLSNILACSMSK